MIPSKTSFTFEEDQILGDNSNPVQAMVNTRFACSEVNENEDASWQVDPNPFIEEIQVRFDEDFTGDIAIYDLCGKLLFSQKVSDTRNFELKSTQIATSMVSGMYFIKTTRENGETEQKRIIKISK